MEKIYGGQNPRNDREPTTLGPGMTDYCFPDVTVEELAEKLLLGIYPHQISPKTRLRCQTFAIALKSLPQDDPRTERLFGIFNRGLDELVERADRDEAPGSQDRAWIVEFLAELRKLIT
jgi:hypothetical protein